MSVMGYDDAENVSGCYEDISTGRRTIQNFFVIFADVFTQWVSRSSGSSCTTLSFDRHDFGGFQIYRAQVPSTLTILKEGDLAISLRSKKQSSSQASFAR
jgi:hypothetical protein